jgi:hypothetical protein
MPVEEPRRPNPAGSAEAVPSDQDSGDEPMTAAQASDLKTLSEQAREPEAFDRTLTRTEASRRINMLTAKLRLAVDPPHTA